MNDYDEESKEFKQVFMFLVIVLCIIKFVKFWSEQ